MYAIALIGYKTRSLILLNESFKKTKFFPYILYFPKTLHFVVDYKKNVFYKYVTD